MLNKVIKFILILLFIFTPIAFGSVELWAFSLMELGILLLVILWALQNLKRNTSVDWSGREFGIWNLKSALRHPHSAILVILSLFLILVLFQMIPLPAWITKVLSPKTYELRQSLSFTHPPLAIHDSRFPLSFVPFLTKVEFYKWLTLIGLFLFLLHWRAFGQDRRIKTQIVMVIFAMGVFESLYGMFEFFSGHHQILHLKGIASVTGTFINRNYFAGYLLMVIPLSMGFFFYREALQGRRSEEWRQRLSSLDGKTLLIAFGIIVMILGLIFSASRMGILSLLLSFTLISFLFKPPRKAKGVSKTSLLILGLALLWALWIGLDAVISRFFDVSEDLKGRWVIWGDTFKIVKDFPILGSGLGTFSQIFPMYKSFHIRRFVSHAENDLLQLASEVGWVGAGVLFILFILLFVRGVSKIRSMLLTNPERYLGIGALVGILSLVLHSLVERNLQIPANAFLFAFLWALLLRVGSSKQSQGQG